VVSLQLRELNLTQVTGASPELKDILERSAALLSQAQKTIYFMNATSLFAVCGLLR